MRRVKVHLFASLMVMALAAPQAQAQSGPRLGDTSQSQQTAWPRWQLNAGHLLIDHYWYGLRPAGASHSGAFFATSGLLLGQRRLALGAPLLGSSLSTGLTASRSVRLASGPGDAVIEPWSAAAYVGIGYSGVFLRSGWGFTADVGLLGTSGGLRTRRDSNPGAQGIDELLRELRLTPVLQFRASYAF